MSSIYLTNCKKKTLKKPDQIHIKNSIKDFSCNDLLLVLHKFA